MRFFPRPTKISPQAAAKPEHKKPEQTNQNSVSYGDPTSILGHDPRKTQSYSQKDSSIDNSSTTQTKTIQTSTTEETSRTNSSNSTPENTKKNEDIIRTVKEFRNETAEYQNTLRSDYMSKNGYVKKDGTPKGYSELSASEKFVVDFRCGALKSAQNVNRQDVKTNIPVTVTMACLGTAFAFFSSSSSSMAADGNQRAIGDS